MEKYIFICPSCGNTTEIFIDKNKAKDLDLSREIAISTFSKCTECGEINDLQIEITSQNIDTSIKDLKKH